jgi:filamentous hemagglutinin family protein
MKGDRWFLTLLLGMNGAIAVFPFPAMAQLRPIADLSLGTTVAPLSNQVNSQVNSQVDLIRNGTRSANGANLFHSFQAFDIDQDRAAYFIVPDAKVVNILARVTGGNPSQILGILGSRGEFAKGSFPSTAANLFLMNPSGILFGEKARLDLGGSFAATTASGIEFGDRGNFGAMTAGREVPVLVINPSAYLFSQVPTGGIVNRSVSPNVNGPEGLRVTNGQSLTFLGRDIVIEAGRLSAFGGRVNLGAVAASGRVEILPTGALDFAAGLERGNVALKGGAVLEVRSSNGGNVGITAGDIQIIGGSRILAGIRAGAGSVTSQSGEVRLDATGTIRVEESRIANDVNRGATGTGGAIRIAAKVLQVTGGAQLSTSTFGTGSTGNLVIDVGDRVLFQGSSANGQIPSAAFSNVGETGKGKGGDVTVITDSLEVRDGARLDASTNGQGDAGNVVITARDRLLFQGVSANGELGSAAYSRVGFDAIGKGGNVEITAGNVEIRDGGGLIANTEGLGNAGNVVIKARDRVVFQGTGPNSQIFLSSAFSNVGKRGKGKGGNVEITTDSLEVLGGAQLIASTDGQGDAGNVVIKARDRVLFQGRSLDGQFGSDAFSDVTETGLGKGGNVEITTGTLELRDGAQLVAATNGRGDAGNVVIAARDRVFLQRSSAFSNVGRKGQGNGGNLEIVTDSLELRDGSQLLVQTNGQGNAGQVTISARNNILLDGTESVKGISSGIISSNGQIVGDGSVVSGTGRGGDITLTTPQLQISNGAVIDAQTANPLPGGNITLNLVNLTLLAGGQILSTSVDQGPAGTIRINATGNIWLAGSDGTYSDRRAQFGTVVAPISANSGLYVRSTGTGSAGNIFLTTPNLTLTEHGRIDAQSATVTGGNIFLTVPNLLILRNSSQISATAGTTNPQAPGNGGNIDITARFIVAIPKENSDITANATQGRGGNININSQGIFGLKRQPKLTLFSDITASSDIGLTGKINLNTPDNNNLQNGLTQLPDSGIDTNALLANSCIIRLQKASQSSFYITGPGTIPISPGDLVLSDYPTSTPKSWKLGEPIIEPQGFYKLTDGRLVMSHRCDR